MLSDEMRTRIESVIGQRMTFFQELHAGYVNSLYNVWFQDNKYIVKIYNALLPDEQILLSTDIQIRLSYEKLAPKIVYLINDMKPVFAVHEHVANIKKIMDANYYYSIGFLLGKIHKNLSSYHSNHAKEYQPDEIITYKNRNIDNALSLNQQNLLEKKCKLRMLVHELPSIEKQIIHGDYYKGNILIHDNDYYAIDFDESKIYYRVYDVIKVIVNAIQEYGYNGAYSYANAFLSGYEQTIKLLNQEIKYMPDIYAYTLSNNTSCLETKTYNLDEMYLGKRIALHEFILSEFNQIRFFINSLNYRK